MALRVRYSTPTMSEAVPILPLYGAGIVDNKVENEHVIIDFNVTMNAPLPTEVVWCEA